MRRAFSVAVYARRAERVLIIEHKRLQTWLPIGGELEAGESPLEAAVRELREETGLAGAFRALAGAPDGVPAGLIGYEEHAAGSKGLHMNFVFVCAVDDGAEVVPNDEFGAWRWVTRAELAAVESPLNVRQFGYLALDARAVVRIRQHVNPNGVFFEQFRGERPPLDGRPVELEIGCADAQFLFERAALDPSQLYVGLEIRQDLVELVNKRARREGVPVHAVFCQAQLHVEEIFAAGSVDRVYINFPDPWFKRAHHDRRMVDAKLVEQVAHAVRRGGDIFVQSDVWEIALDAMTVFERDPRFANQAGEWTFWKAGNPYGVRSWREQNAEETGLPIWRIRYTRV